MKQKRFFLFQTEHTENEIFNSLLLKQQNKKLGLGYYSYAWSLAREFLTDSPDMPSQHLHLQKVSQNFRQKYWVRILLCGLIPFGPSVRCLMITICSFGVATMWY